MNSLLARRSLPAPLRSRFAGLLRAQGQGQGHQQISRSFVARRLLSSSTQSVQIVGTEVMSPTIGLSEDQATFYELAKSFSDNEMKPYANEWDEKSIFHMETFKKLAELGFAGIFVNEEYGGSGLNRVDTTVIVEALATGCVGTTAMLTIHNMCAGMLDKFASKELKEKYLPKLCSLELMASYCLTEPASGSDAGSLSTSAKLDESTQEYVINGGKCFISGAGLSDVYLVMCRTGTPEEKGGGVSCILIPKDTPGMSFGSNEEKMGWKCQPTRQIIFEDCRVPVTNRVGEMGKGFDMAKAGLDGGRLSIGACSLGAATECFNIAVAYAKERKQFGKAIIKNQAIQFKLAKMAEDLCTSRLALRNAAKMLDEGHPLAPVYCAMAKKIATDKGFDVCNEALQMHGGYGYLKDYSVERYLRDVRVHQILEGTNEIMSMVVGKAISS